MDANEVRVMQGPPQPVHEVVCRPRVGLWVLGTALMAPLALFLVLVPSERLSVAVGGAGILLLAGELRLSRETVTFGSTRVSRKVPGSGRVTWWLDGKASLHYLDDISEPGRWWLPLRHEGLVLVYPGDQLVPHAERSLTAEEVPLECDLLYLVEGKLTNEPAWAQALCKRLRTDDSLLLPPASRS